MNEIRAFVGHSFNPEDSQVVAEFLKYFDQLKGIHPAFSWEHAEAAEPKRLAEKVFALLEKKNTFIAICTRKERVIADASLVPMVLQPGYKKAKILDLEWKASDWVIQEIGLAKGRGLELILLLEEGIRSPGGLQGDIEYISFNRDRPADSFIKILEMIRALTPRQSAGGATGTDKSPAETGEADAFKPVESDGLTPDVSWDRNKYTGAAFRAIYSNNDEAFAKINESYLATPEAQIAVNKGIWEANIQGIRLMFGKGGSLDALKRLTETYPTEPEIWGWLGSAYSLFDDHEKAAGALENAASSATAAISKQNYLNQAAVQQARAGNLLSAKAILNEMRLAGATDTALQEIAINTVREIADIGKDPEVAIVALERLVELCPADIDTRFNLAFKHSELGNAEMAFLHYMKIPYRDRTAITWNNLGVSFDRHSMSGKSIQAYKKSAEMGETLAMSNLGYAFMNAGFLKEAQEQFDRAVVIKDFHKNVGQGLASLKEIPETEDKKEVEVLEQARPKMEFYKAAGGAIAQPDILTVAPVWRGPNCALAVAIRAGRFSAVGEYETEGNLLAGVLIGGLKKRVLHTLNYEGIVDGRLVSGSVRKKNDGQTNTLLTPNDAASDFLGIFGEDGLELKILEAPHSTNATFYSLKLVQDHAQLRDQSSGQLPSL